MLEALIQHPNALLVTIAVLMALVVILALRKKPHQKPYPRPILDPDDNAREMDDLEKETSILMQAEISRSAPQSSSEVSRPSSKTPTKISTSLRWEANQSIAAEEERQRSREWNWGKDPAF